jgi:hypothetical protein
MSHTRAALAALAALTSLLTVSPARATNYSLWIHGRNTAKNTQPGNYADFIYWGSASASAGVNKKAVNWDGVSHISDTNYLIRQALDCYCTGTNWCYVATHSAGAAQLGYALSLYGGTTRSVRNATPDSSGACGTTGGTQTGWNIKWVDGAAGADGGSELADLGYWAVSDALSADLRTSTIRAMYDHNSTRGKWTYLFAGASGTLYSGALPGQDDEAVAYHSSGGMAATGSFCNPGDWFCDGTLNYGSDPTGSVAKWSYRTVQLRDDSESYNHYTNGAWGGIVSQARADMAACAY